MIEVLDDERLRNFVSEGVKKGVLVALNPVKTQKEIDELAGRTDPSKLRIDGLADRLRSVPSLVVRFHGLTCNDLGLSQNRWMSVSALKDKAADS